MMQWLLSLMGRRNNMNGLWQRTMSSVGNNKRSRVPLIALGIGAIVFGLRRAR